MLCYGYQSIGLESYYLSLLLFNLLCVSSEAIHVFMVAEGSSK